MTGPALGGPARAKPTTARSAQKPAERARVADAARLAAFDTLRAVSRDDAYANLVLPGLLRERKLGPRDAGFATELAYGTLRLRGRYDAILAACVDRPLTELDPALWDALRLGAHQILAMRVPAHAAVSETVALVRQQVGGGPGALTNAVLRKVAAQSVADWITQLAPSDPIAALAQEHSHPAWIVRALRGALLAAERPSGVEVEDELAQLLASHNLAPQVSLVARPGVGTVDELLAAGAGPGRWSPHAATWAGDPRQLVAVREGRAGAQDEGSQLMALALAEVPLEGPDRRWLDLCAGPGGKAALLGGLASQRLARVSAVEVAEHRAQLVRQSVGGLPVDVVCADGRTVGSQQPGAFDRVLVDVPCTGLGALRRRPEARWRRIPTDLAALAPLQRELLASGLAAARPGGVVAYVTCSPHPAETRFVVEDVLRQWPACEVLPATDYLPMADAALAGSRSAQLWPHRHGTDAMFLTLIRRGGQT